MNLLEKIKKIDWQYLVSRREALLCRSFTDNSHKYFKKLTGIPWRANFAIRSDGPFLHSKKELDKLYSIFLKGGIKVLSEFRQKVIFYVKSLDQIASRIEKIDCSKLTKTELVQLLKKYVRAALYAHNFLNPMPIADRALSKLIFDLLPSISEKEKQELLGILTYPIKENKHIKEEKSFYKLAIAFQKKDKNFNYLLQLHLKNFAIISARCYWWNKAWTKQDIEERLKNFFAQNKNLEKELKHLDEIKKKMISDTHKLLKRFNIKKASRLYKLIHLAKEFVYLRIWRTDIIYGAGYKARGLFYELARRAAMKKEDVVYLTFQEVEKMATSEKPPISPRELAKRKEFSASVLMNGKYTILSGKEWQRKLKDILSPKVKTIKEISGSIAYPGKIAGLAKIVLTVDDLNKVQRGDVLVAVMTFPHFVPAMEKASAFVTDEGGILCHAAIVSREMRKPCIIGTKIATKVLKDGQLIEVDANKGIVKIIKK